MLVHLFLLDTLCAIYALSMFIEEEREEREEGKE